MKWIWRNRKWLFSGAGVSILLLIAGWISSSFHSKSVAQTPTAPARSAINDIVPDPGFTKPTPKEIIDRINKLTPFQQATAAGDYIGQSVYWPAKLKSLRQLITSDTWLVALDYDDGLEEVSPPVIYCREVDLKAYPRLKLTAAGEALRMRGTITTVDASGIMLRDVSFEFGAQQPVLSQKTTANDVSKPVSKTNSVLDWLFSGIGGTILLGLAGYLYRRYKGTKSSAPIPATVPLTLAASPAVPPAVPVKFTKPTPEEIKKQLAPLPPFQQKQAANNYKGLGVYWPAIFRDIDVWRNGTCVVRLHYDHGDNRSWPEGISCYHIDIEAYPKFKFIHAGERMRVRGIIAEVYDTGSVQLQDASFEFD